MYLLTNERKNKMAKYCSEKFERDNGVEQIVCWRQDKHVHDAAFITTIKQKLGTTYGGIWDVRINSYQPGLSKCPTKSVDYNDLT